MAFSSTSVPLRSIFKCLYSVVIGFGHSLSSTETFSKFSGTGKRISIMCHTKNIETKLWRELSAHSYKELFSLLILQRLGTERFLIRQVQSRMAFHEYTFLYEKGVVRVVNGEVVLFPCFND